MTTVIGWSFLTLFASRRDFAIGSYDLREPLFLDERIAERVGDEQAKLGQRRRIHQGLQFGDQPKLRDRERTELDFESDQALGRGLDRAAHGACALIFVTVEAMRRSDAEKERARADRRIGHDHVGGGEASGPLEQWTTQRLVDEVDHRRHDFWRRVIGAGPLAKRVVVDLQKVLVEVEPCFGLVLADRVPIDLVKNARQRSERCLERILI